jgi:hypothetical protein
MTDTNQNNLGDNNPIIETVDENPIIETVDENSNVPRREIILDPDHPDYREEDDPNIIHLTPEEEAILRRDFGLIANVFKKNLQIIVQEVTFPNDPRGDIIIDHAFKPELDENGTITEVKYNLLFWKSGLNHRRSLPPEHAVLVVLSLLENHETTPQFMFDCGQNIKVAYGQLPTNLWAYVILISRLEDMDFDDIVPDESELSTRKRYRENYIKYVEHFRKIAKEIIESKGKELPVNPEPEESEYSEESGESDDEEYPKNDENNKVNSHTITTTKSSTTKSSPNKDDTAVEKQKKRGRPIKILKKSPKTPKKRGRPKKVTAQ